MKMDEMDIAILDALDKDSRLSMRELAKQVNLSAPSVTERVRKLESEGIIEGYSIKINRKKLGMQLDCIIEVTVRNGDYNRFKQYAESYPRVLSCVRVAGRACFFVRICVYDLIEIERFIDNVAAYTTACTHIIFSEINISTDIRKQLHPLD
jgi:Lrp/AsnC family leucine-responsive transcriptional regulator